MILLSNFRLPILAGEIPLHYEQLRHETVKYGCRPSRPLVLIVARQNDGRSDRHMAFETEIFSFIYCYSLLCLVWTFDSRTDPNLHSLAIYEIHYWSLKLSFPITCYNTKTFTARTDSGSKDYQSSWEINRRAVCWRYPGVFVEICNGYSCLVYIILWST